MLFLGNKDGKPWWYKYENDNWIPVTEDEDIANKKYSQDRWDEICAKVFNEVFKEKNT